MQTILCRKILKVYCYGTSLRNVQNILTLEGFVTSSLISALALTFDSEKIEQTINTMTLVIREFKCISLKVTATGS